MLKSKCIVSGIAVAIHCPCTVWKTVLVALWQFSHGIIPQFEQASSMSALGQKQTCAAQKVMSALPPIATVKADIAGRDEGTGIYLRCTSNVDLLCYGEGIVHTMPRYRTALSILV